MKHLIGWTLVAWFGCTVAVAHAQECSPIVADVDLDGDVDLDDLTQLIDCLTGPVSAVGGACVDADITGDNRIDLLDYATQQLGYTGSACGGHATAYLTTTLDFGHTFVPYLGQTPTGVFLGRGLAALDDMGTLVMHADNQIKVSRDDGCNWGAVGGAINGVYRVAAGSSGYAYVWKETGPGIAIHQVRDTLPGAGGGPVLLAPWTVVSFDGPVSPLRGLGVDPANPLHVRTAGNSGQLYESFNGGQTWLPIGLEPGIDSLGYVIKFNPHDFDHAIYGRALTGGFVTFDAGQTWTQATGLSASGTGDFNLFNVVFAGPNGDVVYAGGVDFEQAINGHPTGGRHLFVSTDGGLSYMTILDQGTGGVLLQNSPEMLADPDDPNILRFVFTLSPSLGGTIFYTYDLSTGGLEIRQDPNVGIIRGMYRSRVTPCAIHLTLEHLAS